MEHSTHWKVGAVRWKDDRRSSGLRLAKEAEAVLLAASQDMMVYVFQDANLLRAHAKRETLFAEDVRCVRALRKSWGDYSLQDARWMPEDDEGELIEAGYWSFVSLCGSAAR